MRTIAASHRRPKPRAGAPTHRAGDGVPGGRVAGVDLRKSSLRTAEIPCQEGLGRNTWAMETEHPRLAESTRPRSWTPRTVGRSARRVLGGRDQGSATSPPWRQEFQAQVPPSPWIPLDPDFRWSRRLWCGRGRPRGRDPADRGAACHSGPAVGTGVTAAFFVAIFTGQHRAVRDANRRLRAHQRRGPTGAAVLPADPRGLGAVGDRSLEGTTESRPPAPLTARLRNIARHTEVRRGDGGLGATRHRVGCPGGAVFEHLQTPVHFHLDFHQA